MRRALSGVAKRPMKSAEFFNDSLTIRDAWLTIWNLAADHRGEVQVAERIAKIQTVLRSGLRVNVDGPPYICGPSWASLVESGGAILRGDVVV